MVSLRCGDYMTTVDLSNVDAERVEGKDYSAGYRTYGFAAPFTRMDQQAATGQAQAVVGQ